MLKKFLRMLIVGLSVCSVFPLAVGHAQSTGESVLTLSEAEARTLARDALLRGDLQLADAVTSALLQKNPNDTEALLVRAFLLRAAGRLDEVVDTALSAHRHSDISAFRFDAAMLAADALAQQEKFTRAQIWLRRADQAAPDDQRRQLATNAYRTVSRRNPLRVQLSFSVRPSDNINNGTNPDATADFLGIPLSGQESLQGFEAGLSASLTYRLSEDQGQRTNALLQFYGRKVFISEPELAQIVGARESDYDYASLFAGIQHSRLFFEDWGPTHGTFRIGSSYFGRSHYTSVFEISLAQEIKFSESSALQFGITRTEEHRVGSPSASSLSRSFSTTFLTRSESGSVVSLGGKIEDIDAISGGVDGRWFETNLRYSWANTHFGIRPDISLRWKFRDYPGFQIGPRKDRSIYTTLGLTLVEMNYLGFQPRIEASFSKTNSNIDIFDSDTIGFGFNLVSRF